jgi:glycosyltransferase involved in cell wall biosynthesis
MLTGVEKRTTFVDADLFVQPSHQEGHSIAVTEALYYGIPVIVTKRCAMSDIEENGAGLAVESNPASLCEAIVTLLDQPLMRKRMGEAGRTLVMKRYTWDAIAPEMIRVYRELQEGRLTHGW